MFFNYDSFEIGAIVFVISGILIHYFCNSNTALLNESLVNTTATQPSLNSIPKLDSNIQLNNLPNNSYVDAVVQTEENIQVEASVQAANTYVNTGMQTSTRMWLESIKNWIDNILGTTPSHSNPGYVDVGVQTNGTSLFGTVKQWFLDVYSIRSSELSSMGYNKVTKWRNNLDEIQSVNHNDSESPLTIIRFGTDSPLQQLVGPDDSASNVSEVISDPSLQNVSNIAERVYDITDPGVLQNLMEDPSVYSYFDITDSIYYVISDAVLTVDPSIVNLLISVN